jgi:hypothetical protein
MNAPLFLYGRNPFDDPVDRILAEIAISSQLPPSLHKKACQRFKAAREHLEADVRFEGNVEHFYPQGSMAIDATISTRGTDNEYDLDFISQLGGRFRHMSALDILKEVESAYQNYPVQKIVRQTRCVTLYYADNMHLDITPALRAYGRLDREGWITHAKGPRTSSDDHFVDMNAYGFIAWYRERTPIEQRLAKAMRDHWLALDTGLEAAEIDEVPEQCDFVVKNTATLALQLLKRFRNVRYANYNGRIPPSVMLSYYAGIAAKPDMSLSDMLIRQANWIVGDIEQASGYGQLLRVTNPICEADVFTDRWPTSLAQQNEFATMLKDLVVGIEAAKRGEVFPNQLMDWLRVGFGDRVVTMAADRMADEIGGGVRRAEHGYGRKGSILLPSAAAVAAVAAPSVVRAQSHTFFGEKI